MHSISSLINLISFFLEDVFEYIFFIISLIFSAGMGTKCAQVLQDAFNTVVFFLVSRYIEIDRSHCMHEKASHDFPFDLMHNTKTVVLNIT